MSRYVSPTHSVPVVSIEKGLYNMRQFVISLPSVADRGSYSQLARAMDRRADQPACSL